MDRWLLQLHRLRKWKEEEARLDLVRQENARAQSHAAVEATMAKITHSQETRSPDDAAVIARHHAHVLRLEMQRRRETQALRQREREVEKHRDRLVRASQDTRTVENLADARRAEEAAHLAKQVGRALDEVGSQMWWRKSA